MTRPIAPTVAAPLAAARPETRRADLDAVAVVLVVGCCLLWGLNQVAAKVALTEVGPLWQAAARSVGGALLVAAWARSRGVPLGPGDGTARGGLIAGTLFGIEFASIFIGLETTTASRMAVFIYISPFVVALGMPFIARSERLGAWQTVGLVLAFAGVAFAFGEGFSRPATGPRQWVGDTLGVLGGVIWGVTTLTVRATALARAPAAKVLLWQLAVSGVLLTLLAVLRGDPLPARLSPGVAALLGFQVVIVTAASYLVWFGLIARYPATRLSSFTLLTPVFGLFFGGLLLHEPITGRLLAAVAAVALGIVLVNRRGRPAPR